MEALKQLQELLRDLFQLDLADLDFGLYRLLRLKQKEVEAFLSAQLPRRVDEAFYSVTGEQFSALGEEISKLSARIKEEIGDDALLPNGEIKPEYRDTKVKSARNLIASYEKARQQLHAIKATEEQKSEVFNHLYAFFSRYYESGDFIPRRRYGVREAYAIPYNGEETFFYWPNKDQHYVKTGETFRDYAFSVDTMAGSCQVRFILAEASLPPGNTKGDTRYFFPLPDQVTWGKESRTLHIPFYYRLPAGEEIEKRGTNSKFQEAVLHAALPKILEAVPEFTLRSALSEIVEEKDDQTVSLLLRRMRHFCRRNTTDYFIHRDLDGFLKRELEFYLKDQVLHLADIEGDLEAKRLTIRVIRQLAELVITFLAQIENAQKRLFQKKKFVLRTDYLVPIKEVPHELWSEVLDNKDQLEAWKELFSIEPKKDLFNQKGKINEQFIKDHPALVVNTFYFSVEFKGKLLSVFGDIDEATDGVLMYSENYQALRFLERKYADKVKCIYIDPPYNTGSDEFIYKDRYRHSSWAAMMKERLALAWHLMQKDGALFISIDDHENGRLRSFLEALWGEDNFITEFVIQSNPRGRFLEKYVATSHEYLLFFSRDFNQLSIGGLPLSEEQLKEYRYIDNQGMRYRLLGLRKRGAYSRREDRPNLHFPIFYNPVTNTISIEPSPTSIKIIPKLSDGSLGVWRWSMEKINRDKHLLDVKKVGGRNEYDVYQRDYLPKDESKMIKPKTIWMDKPLNYEKGKERLKDLFAREVYDYPKPVGLVERILTLVGEEEMTILDFFAGSGTTGDSVINLNREDGGQRKFILVEMADYFDTVLLPRIQKVMYAPEWKDGKPKRLPTKEEIERTPRLVKILRLEGYEDALHNLMTEETLKREEPRAGAYKERLGEDDYRLHYLVRLPLEASASMLNLAALEHPFSYKLEVLTDDGPKMETVDLIETFNFLYGIQVQRVETWTNNKDKRIYKAVKGKNKEGNPVLVIWREMEGLDPVSERHFLEGKLKAEGPFDEVLINGDTATPGMKSLDGLFKRLMEEEEK